MQPTNIEIKATCENSYYIEKVLAERQAQFIGVDHQIDTYFVTPNGRLKLREGNIENNLIFYERSDQVGPKQSDIILYRSEAVPTLKTLLEKSMGIKVVVDKQRKIFFLENVKFHIDEVKGLGHFVEIEAIDEDGSIGIEKLEEQCRFYMELFEISATDLVAVSYSDLMLALKS